MQAPGVFWDLHWVTHEGWTMLGAKCESMPVGTTLCFTYIHIYTDCLYLHRNLDLYVVCIFHMPCSAWHEYIICLLCYACFITCA